MANARQLPYYLIPALLLCLLVKAMHPYFGYYIDPDAVSYLTLVNRYLAGDYAQAVNAFWSPMGIWLTVLMIKLSGWQHFNAAIVVNTIAAVGVVVASQAVFYRFRKNNWERFCFGIMSAVFWATTVYRQSFTDIWQCFFLMLLLLLLLRNDFTKRFYWWLLAGLMGALSYFSKAYSFYFVPLLTAIIVAMKLLSAKEFRWISFIKINAVVCMVMLLIALPWIWMLHDKYHIWTNSTAGKMNLSWWVIGHPNLKDEYKLLIPPAPYRHSLYYFEDSYLSEKATIGFWSSPQYFLKQLLRVGYNCLDWVRCSNLISPFYFVVWLLSLVFLGIKKYQFRFTSDLKIILFTFLLFPLPYFLMTFDSGRYLWFTMPLSAILGLCFFDNLFSGFHLSKKMRNLFIALFFFSYLPASVLEMKNIFKEGNDDYSISQKLNELNIHGSFVTNDIVTSDNFHRSLRIAYWTQNPIYAYGENKWGTNEILKDAKCYKVKYYFYWYAGTGNDYRLIGLDGKPYPERTNNSIPGLKVFEIDEENIGQQ